MLMRRGHAACATLDRDACDKEMLPALIKSHDHGLRGERQRHADAPRFMMRYAAISAAASRGDMPG